MLGGVRADLAALRAAEVALRATAAGYVVRVEGAAPGGAEDRSLRSAVAAGAEEVRVAREYAAIGAHPAPLPRHPTLPTVAHILGRTRERLLHPLFGRIWSPGLR
ncbi:MAG: hypothetical protein M5T61_05615 [Acidimicrobiia bacterium]|nr:hypothetical protein [Acidimicrobiia bacterium]